LQCIGKLVVNEFEMILLASLVELFVTDGALSTESLLFFVGEADASYVPVVCFIGNSHGWWGGGANHGFHFLSIVLKAKAFE